MTKTIPKKKTGKKAKWLFDEALQISEKREVKGKREQSFARGTLVIANTPTTQEMTLHMDVTKWSIPKSN